MRERERERDREREREREYHITLSTPMSLYDMHILLIQILV